MKPTVLAVGGSDSGGGAGIQADLRSIVANGGYPTTAITAVTAQNLARVDAVHEVPPGQVRAQLDAVLDGFPVRVVKTGMLWSVETIETVAEFLEVSEFPCVVDPVMVATSGARLLKNDAVSHVTQRLIPRAVLCTPNLDEAAVLLARPSISDHEHEQAAVELANRLGVSVLVKGGHRRGDLVDILVSEGGVHRFESTRSQLNTHGSGCALASSIATHLARGRTLVDAVGFALSYIARAAHAPVCLAEDVRVLGLDCPVDDLPVSQKNN